MSFSLGVFEVFAHAVPGALQLAVFYHVAWSIGAVDLSGDLQDGAIVWLGLGLAASLILGHLMYPISRWASFFVTRDKPLWQEVARRDFRERNPSQADRTFIDADQFLLVAAIQIKHADAAVEVARHRSQGIMLRSPSIPLATGAAVAAGEVFRSDWPALAALTSVALALFAVGAMREGQKLGRWATSKTFELAAWIPGIDDQLSGPDPTT